MKPALIVDAEHDACLIDRVQRSLGTPYVQRERLLHVNMLSRLCRALDLFLMLEMGCREYDRIDFRILEDGV